MTVRQKELPSDQQERSSDRLEPKKWRLQSTKYWLESMKHRVFSAELPLMVHSDWLGSALK